MEGARQRRSLTCVGSGVLVGGKAGGKEEPRGSLRVLVGVPGGAVPLAEGKYKAI